MIDLDFIICPKCGNKIPVSEALIHKIKEKFEIEFKERLESISKENQKLQESLKLREQELQFEFSKKEIELREKLKADLIEQRKKLKEEFEKEARAKVELELEDLRRQNQENLKRLEEAKNYELKLRSEKRRLEEQRKNFELEMQRKLDEEREKISLKIQEELYSKFNTQKLEYEKKLSDMQKALEEAQRKGLATSERFRGEIKEIDLEHSLKEYFVFDDIMEVPKGVSGADVIQVVKDAAGRVLGKIVWECKRTKSFKEEWTTKLKDDVIKVDGNFAILVTQVLPEGIKSFDYKNGVWITDFYSYLQLASVLRMNLFEIRKIEKLNEGKDQKMSMIYEYLSSDQFKNKIIAVIESYKLMQDQLEKEKRAFAKIWSAREMQIRRMTEGTLSILGDMQGIMGNSLPEIPGTELPGLE